MRDMAEPARSLGAVALLARLSRSKSADHRPGIPRGGLLLAAAPRHQPHEARAHQHGRRGQEIDYAAEDLSDVGVALGCRQNALGPRVRQPGEERSFTGDFRDYKIAADGQVPRDTDERRIECRLRGDQHDANEVIAFRRSETRAMTCPFPVVVA
jgi:hypothetical protein